MDRRGRHPEPLFKGPSQGAATALWAATASELVERGGVYCEDCGLKAIVPSDHADVVAGGVKEWAIDPDAAQRLWEVSTQATGLDIFAT